MFSDIVPDSIESFTPAGVRNAAIERAGGRVIGRSEAGRPVLGIELGRGPLSVSLIAGNHSDEPVGSETLRLLAEHLAGGDSPLLQRFTFRIVPHTNPDGEAKQTWIDDWPDPLSLWRHAFREPPGRDVEFGYPEMRPENAAVAAFLGERAPLSLHLSLHGMAVADGGWHLIERSWVERTAPFREQYAEAMSAAGLSLFDWDRRGEKGFEYIGPGFNTTPRSDAMKQFFLERGDDEAAGKFHLSSMEYVRSLGGDPLCMVTELPLFTVASDAPIQREAASGRPAVYLAFREALSEAKAKLKAGDRAAAVAAIEDFELTPVPISKAVRLQLRAIELGLAAIG